MSIQRAGSVVTLDTSPQDIVTSQDIVALLHLTGFVTGVVLYTMLGAMTLRGDAASISPDSERNGYSMPLAVAALGLVWNVIALAIYALRDFGIAQPSPWLVALGFAALGFLPAVVVHSNLRPRLLGSAGGALTIGAYVLSAAGALLHLMAAPSGVVPSRAGLLTLTIGYGAILVTLLAITARDWQGWRNSLFVIALAAFAVSALHLSHVESTSTPWPVELIGHHASLMLVLVILYQDYKFAFADLFLRRALSLLTLVTVAVTLHVLLAQPLAALAGTAGREALLANVLNVGLWVATALAYPLLRRGVGHFVDRVVLGRADFREVRENVNRQISEAETSQDVLERAAATLGAALSARRAFWRVDDVIAPAPHPIVVTGHEARESALIRIPTTDAPCFAVEMADLSGGRRLLSDDIALMEWVASLAARRIDLLRVTSERYLRDARESEMQQLATEAELRALRAQLNPHFLFNTLTTIGYLLRAAPDRALATLYQLTSLLRAVLRPSDGEFVALGEELELIEAYLAIEHARFEERLVVKIDVEPSLRAMRVPPLILQPLVENAIKHGISPLARGGTVKLNGYLEPNGNGTAPAHSVLRLVVSDSGVGIGTVHEAWRQSGGVGLANVEQRLARYYGDRGTLRVSGDPGGGTIVEISLPA